MLPFEISDGAEDAKDDVSIDDATLVSFSNCFQPVFVVVLSR